MPNAGPASEPRAGGRAHVLDVRDANHDAYAVASSQPSAPFSDGCGADATVRVVTGAEGSLDRTLSEDSDASSSPSQRRCYPDFCPVRRSIQLDSIDEYRAHAAAQPSSLRG